MHEWAATNSCNPLGSDWRSRPIVGVANRWTHHHHPLSTPAPRGEVRVLSIFQAHR